MSIKHKLNIIEVNDGDKLRECIRDIQRNTCISYDLETTGLDPRADDAAINTLQIGTESTQWIIPLNISWSPWKNKFKTQKVIIEKLAKIIEDIEEVVAHSKTGTFDNGWLWIHYGVRFNLTFETKVAAHLINENQYNGLKILAKKYLGAPDYDIDSEDKKSGDIPKKKFMEYGAYDVYYTRLLGLLFIKLLRKQEGLTELFRWLMVPAVRAFEKIDQCGFYVNVKQQARVRKQLQKDISILQNKLKRIADINWGSPQQVAGVFFEKLGLTPLEYTPKGKPSTCESVMLRLAHKHPAPKMLIQLRGHQKNLSTYVDGWLPLMHGKYIYLPEIIVGTVTGRLSSRLHQVPRDPMIRSLIDAPPGWVFFSADYGQIELRLAAMMSGCVALTEVFNRGIDVHLATACELTGLDADEVTKEIRKQAKAVNFGLLYGMGAPKLVTYARDNYEVDITLNQSRAFRNRFFGKYSGLLPWHERQRRLVRSQGQVHNPIGRIRHLPDINSHEDFKRGEAERQAINSPVQGFASDLKLMALVELANTIDWNNCKIIGEVHDSILGIVRIGKVNHYMNYIKKVMESPAILKKFGVKIPLPVVVDIELGAWGSGKKWLPKKEIK
jgi:DNA polymerase-1